MKAAAAKCRECIKVCDTTYRLFSYVEDRQWLCQAIRECIEACQRCAAECESGSMNVIPAIECADACKECIYACEGFDDNATKACKKMCEECQTSCNTLF